MPKNNSGAALGGAIALVLGYVLTQFAVELGKGNVPIPQDWQWLVPILGALVTGIITVITPYASITEARTGFRHVETPPDAPVTNDPPSH